MPVTSWTLTARWVFPVDGPPRERGTVTVQGDRFLAVAPAGTRAPDQDLGNVALLPGLVNAHTHLDLSGLRGRDLPFHDFIAWLKAVIAYRRSLTPSDIERNVQEGLAESLACGTTLVGDIAGQGLSWPVLTAAPLRAIVFYELIGLTAERGRQVKSEARRWLQDHPATSTCLPGLSPHAPYSASQELFRFAGIEGLRRGLPVTVHLAEIHAEEELLTRRDGPLVAFLQDLGVWEPDALAGGIEDILRGYARLPHVLFAHGNYLDPTAPVPASGMIVYCPRTHAAFRHTPHPFRQFLKAGTRVALGTDSLGSSPDLSVLAEARFLHRHHPDVPGATLLRMITLAGAEALGGSDEAGSLSAGKSADLVVLPLPDANPVDPHELIFASDLPIQAVLFRGQWRKPGGPMNGAISPSP